MLTQAHTPFLLPRLHRAEVARLRRAHAHRGPLTLPGANGFFLHFNPGGFPAPKPTEMMRVDVELGDLIFTTLAPHALVHELIQALSASITVDDLPSDLAAILLEASIAGLLSRFEAVANATLTIKGVSPNTQPLEGVLLVLEGPDRQWPMYLSCDELGLAQLLSPWPESPRNLDVLPAQGRVRAGVTTLEMDVLTSLRPGDVVVLETQTGHPGAMMLVVAETLCAAVHVHDSQIELAEAPVRERKDWLMSDSGAPEDEDGHLDDLPVRLAFDLGKTEIEFGELRRLDAGMVLELGHPAKDFVQISANGRSIGRGELVDLDGMLGVRIVRIFAREG